MTRFPTHIGPSTIHALTADCWLAGISEAATVGFLRLIDAHKRDAVLVVYRSLEKQLDLKETTL